MKDQRTAKLNAAGRGERRRQQTRSALVNAARLVMSKKGVEATTIAEITEAADVGFGSFYNFFDSKETIAREVFLEQTERLLKIAGHIIDTVVNPAEVVAFIGRVYIYLGHEDPVWGWFVIHVDKSHDLMDQILGEPGRRYIRAAAKAGKLELKDPDMTVALSLSMFITIIREMLLNKISRSAANNAIEQVLLIHNISRKEAARIMTLPMLPTVLAMLKDSRPGIKSKAL